METYRSIRSKLKTGDIVLFSGKGGISTGIKWFTNSKWSHVGMVIKLENWDTILLWESTTLSKMKDVETQEETQGVQLVALSSRIQNYVGDISIRHLDADRTGMDKTLSQFRAEMKGRPYELDRIELIKSAYDGIGGENKEDLSSLFCSELIAETYQELGLLSEKKPSNEYTPKDFSEKGKINLQKGKLSEEIMLRVEH